MKSFIEKLNSKERVIIAHRGASGYAPENTLASFLKAIELNADAIECDVHLTKDGVPIVIHDEELSRTTNWKGYIKDYYLIELKSLSAGYKSRFGNQFESEKIPTLKEVFEVCKNKVGVVIEIKNGPFFYDRIEEKIIELIKEFNMEDWVIISAFDHQTVKKIKKLNRRLVTAIIFSGCPVKPTLDALLAYADGLHLEWCYLKQNVIEEAEKDNLFINVWTVNNEENIKKMLLMNVNGVITDYPDLGVKVRREMNF
ncbi:MAG: glycerophosphodiester phosphodiesterase family protein [Candidatus Bathyarchaeia archaeon]|nr:glycerophosphodiester phosphodiesterase [Candidatus Bathyarchaeota archaeon]